MNQRGVVLWLEQVQIFTAAVRELSGAFVSGNSFLDEFIKSLDAFNDSIGKRNDGLDIRISDQLFHDFMQKVFALREKYIGFSFVTLAATQEGYSLYKRNYFEELDAELHFSFKDDEKGCIPMYLALDIE